MGLQRLLNPKLKHFYLQGQPKQTVTFLMAFHFLHVLLNTGYKKNYANFAIFMKLRYFLWMKNVANTFIVKFKIFFCGFHIFLRNCNTVIVTYLVKMSSSSMKIAKLSLFFIYPTLYFNKKSKKWSATKMYQILINPN